MTKLAEAKDNIRDAEEIIHLSAALDAYGSTFETVAKMNDAQVRFLRSHIALAIAEGRIEVIETYSANADRAIAIAIELRYQDIGRMHLSSDPISQGIIEKAKKSITKV